MVHSILISLMVFMVCSEVKGASPLDRVSYIMQPEKVSVGPDDSYQGVVQSGAIYYTKNISLARQIHKQTLGQEKVEALLPADGDSKDPAPNPQGKGLAFTYFKYDAKGDICLRSEKAEVKCLTNKDSSDQAPFWMGPDTVGYISRKGGDGPWQLIQQDIESKKTQVLISGDISAPQISPDQTYLVYSQKNLNEVRQSSLVVYHVPTKKAVPIQFELPGITGLSRFSRDGKYLYFSHYLNDSNGDQVIDANDHSVIFRLPLASALKGHSQIPQQLTSIENNCNFPYPATDYLYLTCAFQGSLDLYRLPLEGQVPKQWNGKQLQQAYDVARSYADRLLILNAQHYKNGAVQINGLEKVLSNHLHLNEFTAARFYVRQLIAKNHETSLYKNMLHYLDVREAKSRENSRQLSRSFKRYAKSKLKIMGREPGRSHLKTLVEAYIMFHAASKRGAEERLSRIDLNDKMQPLERYLAFNLYTSIYPKRQDLPRLMPVYLSMMNAKELSQDTQIYYAFRFLSALDKWTKSPKAHKNKLIELMSKVPTTSHLYPLLEAESLAWDIILNKDEKAAKKIFSSLAKLYDRTKDQYFLRKTSYVRGLMIFSAHDRMEYMERVASYWLRYTKVDDIEFYYAAKQFSFVSLDKAYDIYGSGNRKLAASNFYIAVRQTDDLEAHAGFLKTNLLDLNNQAQVDQAYQLLAKSELISESVIYVECLRSLLEKKAGETWLAEDWDRVISKLEGIGQGTFNDGMRYLLLAYSYHMKLRLTMDGLKYDKDLLAAAHRNYILAEYLAQDNFRLQASVQGNLAFLHQDVKNHSLAARYFAKREQMPFSHVGDQLAFRYHYAASLFHSNQSAEAAIQVEKARGLIDNKKSSVWWAPLVDRQAFYSMHARKYSVARRLYDQLLAAKTSSPVNRVRFHLARGFSAYKMKDKRLAIKDFEKVLKLSSTLSIRAPKGSRLVGSYPQRFRIIAGGLLANISSPNRAITLREERISELLSLAGQEDPYRTKEEIRLEQISLDYNHIAQHFLKLNKPAKAAVAMDQALSSSTSWAEAGGGDAGIVRYRTLINYLALGVQFPQIFVKQDQKAIKAGVESALKVYGDTHKPQGMILYRQAKLEMFWLAYQSALVNGKGGHARQGLQAILTSDSSETVREQLPHKYQELRSFANKL